MNFCCDVSTKPHRLNKHLEPSDTWKLWDPQCLTNEKKQVAGRFGLRFKAQTELAAMEEDEWAKRAEKRAEKKRRGRSFKTT